MPSQRDQGRNFEDRAAAYLTSHGYTIITRRYTTRSGEIDIIALDGETLVFVEVKARALSLESASRAVGFTKWSRLVQAAQDYVEQVGLPMRESRFDLVAISGEEIEHFKGIG